MCVCMYLNCLVALKSIIVMVFVLDPGMQALMTLSVFLCGVARATAAMSSKTHGFPQEIGM